MKCTGWCLSFSDICKNLRFSLVKAIVSAFVFLMIIHPDDDPSVSKHEAINTVNEVVLTLFLLLIHHHKITLQTLCI